MTALLNFITPLHALFIVSACCFLVFWAWAISHAYTTPNASTGQRFFWCGSLVLNPITAVWYWYIWKRWAFWLLFTPVLGLFATGPFILKRFLSRTDIDSIVKVVNAPGSWLLFLAASCFIVFPLILRLVALFHLGKNQSISAMDRNDWIVALALPIFGFGAGVAYCAKHRRGWAIASLAWWVAVTVIGFEIWRVARPLVGYISSSSKAEAPSSSSSSSER